MEGTDYAEQALNLFHYTEDTNFEGVIWFFYEGNDYEQTSEKVKKIKKNSHKQIDKKDVNYELNINHKITNFFKLKVWFAEFIRGPSVLLKFFKNYDNLLNKKDYEYVLKKTKFFLDEKNIKNRLIVYIPSWQKISLYKLKNFGFYNNHPQIVQLNSLKNNVKEIAEKYEFTFVDTDEYFFDLENPLDVFHYQLNTHFNKMGNEMLASAIIDQLND